MNEPRTVVERYARRNAGDRYSMLRPEVWQTVQERQRALIDLLNRHMPAELKGLRVLEVGCGSGSNLLELMQLGFDPRNPVANELLPGRAALARKRLPQAIMLHQGDALALESPPGSFDIVYQSRYSHPFLMTPFNPNLPDACGNG